MNSQPTFSRKLESGGKNPQATYCVQILTKAETHSNPGDRSMGMCQKVNRDLCKTPRNWKLRNC